MVTMGSLQNDTIRSVLESIPQGLMCMLLQKNGDSSRSRTEFLLNLV
jgi:hypothetical protein